MSRFPVENPKSTRQPPVRTSGTQILFIGDTHIEATQNISYTRMQKVTDDVSRMVGKIQLDAVVQLGDQTNYAIQAEYDNYLAWRAGMITALGSIPFEQVPGNHDIMGANASGGVDIVTPSQWATKMGVSGANRYLDVGANLRLILFSPAQDASVGYAHIRRLTIDKSTFEWASARLAEVPNRIGVACFHAPLENTVGPYDPDINFSSYNEKWHAHYDWDYTVMKFIADNPNLVGWLSGHTHTPVGMVDMVKAVNYGTNTIAAVSASAPAGPTPGLGPAVDPIIGCLVTFNGSTVDVRYRDHGRGQWLGSPITVSV